MSIVRVGMSESQTYGDGYEAIFGKKKPAPAKKTPPAPPKPPATAEAKPPASEGKKA